MLPALSDPALRDALARSRTGPWPALRAAILLCDGGAIAAYYVAYYGVALTGLLAGIALAVARMLAVRREQRLFQAMEHDVDRANYGAATTTAGELLARGPASGKNLRAGTLALLGEIAWQRRLDDDAQRLCEHVLSTYRTSRVGTFMASTLSATIAALAGDGPRATSALAEADGSLPSMRLAPTGSARLALTRALVATARGDDDRSRDHWAKVHSLKDTLDERRRRIADERAPAAPAA